MDKLKQNPRLLDGGRLYKTTSIMAQQHYRMTLEDVLDQYQCGLISATALLYYYLKIRLKPGWKVTLHQSEISQQLGISKASFYKGISRLKEKKLIDWEAPNGLVVSLGQNGDSLDRSETTLDKSETTLDKSETTLDRSETTLDKSETTLDRSETTLDRSETVTPSKTADSKASSGSPNSYQIFFNSLSDYEREKFFYFVREKIKEFPNPINDLAGWLARKNQAGQYRFNVYYGLFNGCKEDNSIKIDWENHPQRDEWIKQIKSGKPRFIALGGSSEEQPMRKAFADWAIANNRI
ncbi:hypothetical protein [Crocosphaera sp.]|uniref:hypothetical protein n=1 Tax=Crocosphaera sp. TaxID=2729996 RepID=UPI0026189DF6|nr:hypothetical protein [Crocosphaera sp.]MDJ0581671.1 hypothetical protein [Crocosphaera sp.]